LQAIDGDDDMLRAMARELVQNKGILAVDTGRRPNSELFTLRWPDVELSGRPESPYGVLYVWQGKTVNAQRSVPLTPRAAEVLQRRKNGAGGSAYVFPGEGNSGHLVSVQHPHQKSADAAGLAAFPFYCWRHTFGTHAVRHGSLLTGTLDGP
jgi:integrase